ncbi:hypothetical protein HS1genome_2318 [Sulfodiicoccus acidiphilus]|uniref:Uncharacterized protein n=1 Tax=Sulfodiicoccus acidiphilus TaxID=1670455 RepID=A0A348B6X7_9CREN|nr:hypothetical protein [Sulfodiicoccus acidiphilus]BBD73929.1 hypothetical protein HS1genome_2318 [Sulfodiicoccus acidiphilus]
MGAPIVAQGEPTVVEFETEGEIPWVTIKLKDGSVLKMKVFVTGVIRVGNDPNTGLPIYAIQTQPVIQNVKIPSELIKKPGRGSNPMT